MKNFVIVALGTLFAGGWFLRSSSLQKTYQTKRVRNMKMPKIVNNGGV